MRLCSNIKRKLGFDAWPQQHSLHGRMILHTRIRHEPCIAVTTVGLWADTAAPCCRCIHMHMAHPSTLLFQPSASSRAASFSSAFLVRPASISAYFIPSKSPASKTTQFADCCQYFDRLASANYCRFELLCAEDGGCRQSQRTENFSSTSPQLLLVRLP